LEPKKAYRRERLFKKSRDATPFNSPRWGFSTPKGLKPKTSGIGGVPGKNEEKVPAQNGVPFPPKGKPPSFFLGKKFFPFFKTGWEKGVPSPLKKSPNPEIWLLGFPLKSHNHQPFGKKSSFLPKNLPFGTNSTSTNIKPFFPKALLGTLGI